MPLKLVHVVALAGQNVRFSNSYACLSLNYDRIFDRRVEAKLVEAETKRRIEEAVNQRVEQEIERRKEAIEAEILRRVEEAKRAMEEQLIREIEKEKARLLEEAKRKQVCGVLVFPPHTLLRLHQRQHNLQDIHAKIARARMPLHICATLCLFPSSRRPSSHTFLSTTARRVRKSLTRGAWLAQI